MLLFSNADKSKGSEGQEYVVIVSSRPDWMSDICSQLVLKNIEPLFQVKANFLTADVLDLPEYISAIIIDIEKSDNCALLLNKITTLLPSSAKCLVVGDTDSITLSQQFIAGGVSYLHYPSQLVNVVQNVKDSSAEMKNRRSAIKISILGCKGGIGNSLISYHVAQHIATKNRVPVLLVQGAGGSQDIDLISDKALEKDVSELTTYLSVKPGNAKYTDDLNDKALERYNFVVFDYPIFNLNKEDIEFVLSSSDCVVLVIGHDLASLSVAKSALDVNRFLRTVSGGVKREFVCLNQIRPTANGVLTIGDLTSLLGGDISSHILYQRPPGDPSKPLRFLAKQNSAVSALANQVLGQNMAANKSTGSSISRLLNKFKK